MTLQKSKLRNETLLKMYETMLLARRIDERMWLLNRAGKLPFVVSCQGHEAAQIGAAFALQPQKDYIAPYYRDLGVVLHFGMTPREIMLGAFAKAEDPSSGGRQMPGHYGQRKNHIITGSSPVTTQIPHAVGVALAGRIKKEDFVTFVTLGEGSTNQGDFHEGLNFAAVQKLPVIIMVENNQYAISVPAAKQYACQKISDRAIGYGMAGVTVDGNDPIAVYEAVEAARERARQGEGPTLIETLVHRLTPHSSDDDEKQYRSQQELESIKKDDPITKFSQYLVKIQVIDEAGLSAMNERVMAEVNDATHYAEQAPFATALASYQHVYAQEARG